MKKTAAEAAGRSDLRRRQSASRQASRSAARSPSVLSLARPRPALLASPPAAPAPLAAIDLVADGEPFSFSEVSIETPGEGEGPPSVERTSLRRRGDSNPSGGCVSCRGRSSLGWLVVVGLAVLLCLLVAAVVGVNRQLSALAGRLEALEGTAAAAGADARIVYCVGCDIGVYS